MSFQNQKTVIKSSRLLMGYYLDIMIIFVSQVIGRMAAFDFSFN